MNDPFGDAPPELLAKAREAKCSRCEAVVVDEPSVTGTIMVSYYVPTLGVRHRVVLCGACGLAFREFIQPNLLQDPLYTAVKAELQARWV